jgi:hypothetical protein
LKNQKILNLIDAEQKILDTLVGKTVAIIGGRRQEQAQKEYPCTVLAHSGEVLNRDFYYTLKQADIIIVLTLPRLLAEVAEQIERS